MFLIKHIFTVMVGFQEPFKVQTNFRMQNAQKDLLFLSYKATNCSINMDGDIKENMCYICS